MDKAGAIWARRQRRSTWLAARGVPGKQAATASADAKAGRAARAGRESRTPTTSRRRTPAARGRSRDSTRAATAQPAEPPADGARSAIYGQRFAIAGRVVAQPRFGKAAFVTSCATARGELQLYVRKDAVGDPPSTLVKLWTRRLRRRRGPVFGRKKPASCTILARRVRVAHQGAAAAAREVARPHRRRAALPPALRRPRRRTPRCARSFRKRIEHRARASGASSTRAASSRSRRR